MADVALQVLRRPALRGRPHVLTGPEALSAHALAERLTPVAGPVHYVDRDPSKLASELRDRALPPWLVEHLVEIQGWALVHPEVPNDAITEITGRGARTLGAFLREHRTAFAREPALMAGPA